VLLFPMPPCHRIRRRDPESSSPADLLETHLNHSNLVSGADLELLLLFKMKFSNIRPQIFGPTSLIDALGAELGMITTSKIIQDGKMVDASAGIRNRVADSYLQKSPISGTGALCAEDPATSVQPAPIRSPGLHMRLPVTIFDKTDSGRRTTFAASNFASAAPADSLDGNPSQWL